MNVEFINPFVGAAMTVLQTMLNEEPKRGQIAVMPACFTNDQVNVVLGVVGHVTGTVILGMSLVTADRIASTMIGYPVKTFDALASSAVGELGNMISGHALCEMAAAGIICDLAPPTVIRGSNVRISMGNSAAIKIPLELTQGTLSLVVSLISNPAAKAA